MIFAVELTDKCFHVFEVKNKVTRVCITSVNPREEKEDIEFTKPTKAIQVAKGRLKQSFHCEIQEIIFCKVETIASL